MTTSSFTSPDLSTGPYACTACREWQRDMNGTLATLNRERAAASEMLKSLQDVVRICEAMRFTTGLGKNQLGRIEHAKTIIARHAKTKP